MIGNSCDLDAFKAAAVAHGKLLFEDTAQAPDGLYRAGGSAQSGWREAYSFSFYTTVNADDGRMVVTDDEELYKRAFASHEEGHLPRRSDPGTVARPNPVPVSNRHRIGSSNPRRDVSDGHPVPSPLCASFGKQARLQCHSTTSGTVVGSPVLLSTTEAYAQTVQSAVRTSIVANPTLQ